MIHTHLRILLESTGLVKQEDWRVTPTEKDTNGVTSYHTVLTLTTLPAPDNVVRGSALTKESADRLAWDGITELIVNEYVKQHVEANVSAQKGKGEVNSNINNNGDN